MRFVSISQILFGIPFTDLNKVKTVRRTKVRRDFTYLNEGSLYCREGTNFTKTNYKNYNVKTFNTGAV